MPRRLTEQQRSELLREVEMRPAREGWYGMAPDPESLRRRLPLGGLARLTVDHAGGGRAVLEAMVRQISQTDLSVVAGALVHPGARCSVEIPTLWNGTEQLAGLSQGCRHISGRFHELVVSLEQPPVLAKFVARDVLLSRGASEIRPETLKGRVLFVDDVELEHQLFKYHVKGTALEVAVASSSEQAKEAVRASRPGIVILDLNLGDEAGESAVPVLRSAGHTGPIIALTGVTDPGRLKAAKDAGIADIIPKPYQRDGLLARIATFMTSVEEDTSPLLSSHAAQPGFEALLQPYVRHVSQVAAALRAARDTDDTAAAARLCQDLAATGGSYGFAPLTDAAKTALGAINASGSVSEAAERVENLLKTIARIPGVSVTKSAA